MTQYCLSPWRCSNLNNKRGLLWQVAPSGSRSGTGIPSLDHRYRYCRKISSVAELGMMIAPAMSPGSNQAFVSNSLRRQDEDDEEAAGFSVARHGVITHMVSRSSHLNSHTYHISYQSGASLPRASLYL